MESSKHFSNTVSLKFVFNINSFRKPKIEKKHLWQSTFHSDLIAIKYKKKFNAVSILSMHYHLRVVLCCFMIDKKSFNLLKKSFESLTQYLVMQK